VGIKGKVSFKKVSGREPHPTPYPFHPF